MSTDSRDRLLEVAARVYAEAGYHGTTTRRIAEEAGLNEVTLFRQFGSKDALLREAIELADRHSRASLNADATDPIPELHRWARACIHRFYQHQKLIRQILGDTVQRPEIAPRICEDPSDEMTQLVAFLTVLETRGILYAGDPMLLQGGAAMLVHSLLSNALWRDLVPDIPSLDDCAALFVEVLLRALRVPAGIPEHTTP
ncbi:MAG: helix-turn-helix domain-containing protein [Gemmatimonadales bacterium]|jgi:AcrR family transcriptional regulator